MSYKTILVHCDATRTIAGRLAAAADVAQRFEARLVGLHAREPFELPAFTEDGVSIAPLMEAYEAGCVAAEKTVAAAYEKATKGRNFPSEWRVFEAFCDDALAVNARYADLLIVGQADPDDPAASRNDLPEVMAFATGRPVLVVPQIGAQSSVGKTVMLCWNASRESARAAADALPFLQAAEKVIVLVVDPEVSADKHGQEPGADVAVWLARHGVKVSLATAESANKSASSVIENRLSDNSVDLLVMGAYTHSRLWQLIFGGTTKSLLQSMTALTLLSR